MFLDGLEDAYAKGSLMGRIADQCVEALQITRDEQDIYAIASLDRALAAAEKGHFLNEIAPVDIRTRTSTVSIAEDEQPKNAKRDKIPTLRPAFSQDGTVTAANGSSIFDGAAALLLTRESVAEAKGLTPIARIIGKTGFGTQPDQFPVAPIGAMEALFAKTDTTASDYDLFEINEAFAAIEDPDPVIILEPKRLYNGPFDRHHDRPVVSWKKHALGDVESGRYTVEIGKAKIRRAGSVAIIGVNQMAIRPLWDGDKFVPRSVMNLSCSFDHRVIDGWEAAVFVRKLKDLLETPALHFVESEN